MLSTVEASKRIGVSKSTLLRWLDEGLVDDVERDWRGWRVWRSRDVERVKAFQKAYHSKPIRRIRRGTLSRAECAKADILLPSLDAGSESLYRKINRALPEPTLEQIVDGLATFRRSYAGKLWVEVMLLKDVNDSEEATTLE